MRSALALSIFFLLSGHPVAAELSPRTGFVDGPVWFSSESLRYDEPVTIYAAVFNGEADDLSVSIDFIDDEDVVLSSKEIVVGANEIETASAEWKVSLGSHAVFARITKANLAGAPVILDRVETDRIEFSVTKEIPGDVAKEAFIGKIKSVFKELANPYLAKADTWFQTNFKKSEEFRADSLKDLKITKEKIATERTESKASKTAVKILVFLHFYLLLTLVFFFSVSVVFYILAIIVAYFVLRTIFRIIRRIFRRHHDE